MPHHQRLEPAGIGGRPLVALEALVEQRQMDVPQVDDGDLWAPAASAPRAAMRTNRLLYEPFRVLPASARMRGVALEWMPSGGASGPCVDRLGPPGMMVRNLLTRIIRLAIDYTPTK